MTTLHSFNDMCDYTADELETLLGDGMLCSPEMKGERSPGKWWHAWTGPFQGTVPDSERFPVAYNAMLSSWKAIANSTRLREFVDVLWTKRDDHHFIHFIDTRYQNLLYHDVPAQWVYDIVGNKWGFEGAYLVAHPNHHFPDIALEAFFRHRFLTSNVQDYSKHVVGVVAPSLHAALDTNLLIDAFNTIHIAGLRLYESVTSLDSFSVELLVRGFFLDLKGYRADSSLYEHMPEKWSTIFHTALARSDYTAFRDALYDVLIKRISATYVHGRTIVAVNGESPTTTIFEEYPLLFSSFPDPLHSEGLVMLQHLRSFFDSGLPDMIDQNSSLKMTEMARAWIFDRVSSNSMGTAIEVQEFV